MSVKLVQLLRGHVTRDNDSRDGNKTDQNGEHSKLQTSVSWLDYRVNPNFLLERVPNARKPSSIDKSDGKANRTHPRMTAAVLNDSADPASFDLIANCTALGLKPGDPVPFDPHPEGRAGEGRPRRP
jgi:hypothetical protein